MLRVGIFAAVTLGLLYLSRRSFRVRRSHGFYRFFAWEAIAALCLLNFLSLQQWFQDSLSPRQLLSWSLLAASLVPLIPGVLQLRNAREGEPDRNDEGLLGFEQTDRLVTAGAFKFIRHPMYSSLLLLCWGVFFKEPGWIGVLPALTATGFLIATARAEERENLKYFGDAYRAYMERTKMFVPFLF